MKARMWKVRLLTITMMSGGTLPAITGCLSDQQTTGILTSVLSTSLSALAGGLVESIFAAANANGA